MLANVPWRYVAALTGRGKDEFKSRLITGSSSRRSSHQYMKHCICERLEGTASFKVKLNRILSCGARLATKVSFSTLLEIRCWQAVGAKDGITNSDR
jgi:hypothetical protein